MDLFKKCRDYDVVRNIKALNVYPYFHQLETKQAPEVVMEGKNIIMIDRDIIKELNLREPIYEKTAVYGHFGNVEYPWEKLDKVDDIKAYLK